MKQTDKAVGIVDPYGRQLPSSPDLGEMGQWQGALYPQRPSQGLTPESLSAIFMEADTGHISRQAELFEEMEEKDAHLGAVLATRKLSVAGLDWQIQAAGETREAQEAAEFARRAVERIPAWDEVVMDLLDAVAKGFAALEIIWELSGGTALISEMKWRPQRGFTFALKGGGTSQEPRLLTEAEPVWGEELPPGKFVMHRFRSRSGEPARAGVMRPCAWMYLFKHYTLKDWLIFCERYAQPMRLGKFSAGASEAERQVLKEAVFNMGSDSAAIISDSTLIELLDSGQKATAEIYESLATYCDRAITKAVLGQTLTTEHSTGTYGAAKVHDAVRREIVEADSRALERTIRTQIIAPLVRYNLGAGAPVPSFSFTRRGGEDLKALAETLKKVGELGVDIPPSYLRERFGIPETDGGEA